MNTGIRIVALLLFSATAMLFAGSPQAKEQTAMTTVRVRYMVNNLDPAVEFYTKYLGFQVKQQNKPNFAMLSRGNLELVLSTPFGPGGAAKPMPDGRKPEPGGWNRIDLVSGPGGSEILLEDPSGNPVELFQPSR